jgi:ribosomal protein S14
MKDFVRVDASSVVVTASVKICKRAVATARGEVLLSRHLARRVPSVSAVGANLRAYSRGCDVVGSAVYRFFRLSLSISRLTGWFRWLARSGLLPGFALFHALFSHRAFAR